MKYNKKELIESIQEDREEVLLYYYKELHQVFFGWAAKRYPLFNYFEIEEIYNDAWLVLTDAVKVKGKIGIVGNIVTGLWSSVIAYLKGIANNLFLNLLTTKGKQKIGENTYDYQVGEGNIIDEMLMGKAFKKLKIRWKRLFYYKFIMQLKYDFIASILPAKNGRVVQSEMDRAKRKLRELYIEEKKREEQEEIQGKSQSDTKNRNTPQQSI